MPRGFLSPARTSTLYNIHIISKNISKSCSCPCAVRHKRRIVQTLLFYLFRLSENIYVYIYLFFYHFRFRAARNALLLQWRCFFFFFFHAHKLSDTTITVTKVSRSTYLIRSEIGLGRYFKEVMSRFAK